MNSADCEYIGFDALNSFDAVCRIITSDEKFERLFKAMGGKQGTEITCDELFRALCPQFEKAVGFPSPYRIIDFILNIYRRLGITPAPQKCPNALWIQSGIAPT